LSGNSATDKKIVIMIILGVITLLVVFGFGILIMVLSAGSYDADAQTVGFFMILLPLLILVCWSIGQDVDCELVEVDCEVVRTSRMTIVDDGKKTHEYTSHVDVSSINDSTTFYMEHTTNMWGGEDTEGFSFKNK